MVGKSYQASVRLSETAVHNWARIDGEYTGKGVDLLALPFPRFLNVVYVWALEHQSQEDAEAWVAGLEKPIHRTGYDDFDDSFDQIKHQ